ncbi:competence protein ComEC [Selenomonas ruminantium]|uniref:Competence protein ComEC n=1 Tax=Selenomonas ruminantium TaxID=971 RepID=A0A1M6UAJ9_SELRU|nr:ComEC/Rec2 family competence protein [Selenomonas ruminantium]SHK66234.1 competence protein ComEC [Selenomonas ruminantium]
MKGKWKFLLVMVLSVCLLLTGCGGKTTDQASGGQNGSMTAEAVKNLTVKMLNVGQGDAILIETPEQTVLIDTSDLDEQEKLRNELKKAGVKRIDKLILTHPHADHIGGVEGVVLQDYEVGEVFDNGMPSKSKVYTRYMKLLKQKNIKRHGLVAGDELDFGGGVKFKVYAPDKAAVDKGSKTTEHHDPNNESVVGRLIFGNFSMMFTGDAEKVEEEPIVKAYGNELKSAVLKAGHHGSKTSSSAEFLRAVNPEAVMISCGAGNDYGHPHAQTMKKYHSMKLKIYETDKNGTITLTTDGKGYNIVTEMGDVQ